jgi:uncharacterized membrane protein
MFSRQNSPALILAIGITVYTSVLTYLSWVQYADLRTPTFDMGVSLQIVQTILQTGLPYETANWVSSNGTQSFNFFGIHFSPVRYLFAGAYWFYPSAATLLFVQALFVSLGSIPTYKLSLHVLGSRRTSVLISGLYLLFPPIIMSNLYDVHEESIVPVALLSAYYFYTTRQYNKSILFFVFMGLIQESVDALIFFAALQLIAFNFNDYRQFLRDRKLTKGIVISLSLLVAAPIAFVLENKLFLIINPGAGFIPLAPQAYAISPLNILSHLPQKAVYWLVLLGLTGFLPLQNKKALILVIPWFVVSVFGGNPDFSVFFFQYNFIIIPALIIGTIYGLEKLRHKKSPTRGIAFRLRTTPVFKKLPIILLIGYLLFTPLYPLLSPYLVPGPHVVSYYLPPSDNTSLDQLFNLIPSNATVLASDYLFPHAVRGISSYPLLHVNNFTSGTTESVIHLPSNFAPEFITIFPIDYNDTVKAVKSFPSSYGLLGEVTSHYIVLTGFSSFQIQTFRVLLYKSGYSGPPKLVSPQSVIIGTTDCNSRNWTA